MKKKIEIVLLIVLFVAVAVALVLTRNSSEPRTMPAPQLKPPTEARLNLFKETTIRNVTDRTISYQISRVGQPETQNHKSIAPREIHRFPDKDSLEIDFNTGEKEVNYVLDPGKPYSFRYDGEYIDLFAGSHGRSDAEDLAPFVPTPQIIVDHMLELVQVGTSDVVYDIGCGDGRIVVTAARKYGAQGVGIDIDPEMIDKSNANARTAGVEPLVRFVCMDATKANISEATVVTIYLLPESNALLRPIFEAQLKPGTRVVSHNYEIPGWEQKLKTSVSMKSEDGSDHNIYVYIK